MIPAFVNDSAGTAAEASKALEAAGGFAVHEIPPTELEAAIGAELRNGARRIVIAGGDGTVATAASLTCGSDVELAVLPGGTLNHFARDHAIPTDFAEAAQVALNGRVEPADVAYVGERLFLNTSSVGAYVSYVRMRERLEPACGYHIASVLAAVRLLFTFRTITVELKANGEKRRYATPLVFIGVGERETKSPEFGSRVAGGRHCLHVLVVRERRAPRLLVLAVDAVTGGLRKVARTPDLDSFLVDSCTVDTSRSRGRHMSVDGEIVPMQLPLHFRIAHGALNIVVPAETGGSGAEPNTSGG